MAASEFIGIELQLIGGEEAYALLQRIDSKITALNTKKKFNTLGGLNSAKRELEGYIKELGQLESKAAKARSAMEAWGDPFKKSAAGQRLSKELQATEQRAEAVRGKIRQMSADMDSVTVKTRTWGQEFRAASSQIAHIGSAMQSLGNALTRLTSPFRRLTTGLLYGAGYKVLNLFTSGLGGAFERADTMKNYARTLQAFGFEAGDATKAVEALNEAVLGLPTGLDEIVAVQKRFLAASQDIEKSTALAIAYNNAILASGSDARQQKTAQRILTQLAGGADIASSSWDALQRAIPLVFTELAKESKMGVADYVSALKTGKITTDEFLKSFNKIGSEGSIKAAAEVMKKSWSGLSANIQNATKRLGEGILESLHEVFKKETGRDLLETLLGIDSEGNRTYDGIRDWIDGMSESIQNWIKSHPDKIIDFFNDLKGIDWKGLVKGFAEGMGMMLKLLQGFAKWASGKDLSKVGKRIYGLSIIGRVLSIVGGLAKGLRHPLAALWTLGNFGAKGGIFAKIASIFGKKKDITAAGASIDAATATATTMGKAAPKLLSAFKNMALLSGIVALPAATAWVVGKGVKGAVKSFKETIDLFKDFTADDWKRAGALLTGITVFTGAFAAIGSAIGAGGVEVAAPVLAGELIAGLVSAIALGFADLDMRLIKDSIGKFVESVELLEQIPDLSSFKGNIGNKIIDAVDVLNEVSRAIDGQYVDKAVKEGGLDGVNIFTAWGTGNIAKAFARIKEAAEEVVQLADINIPEGAADHIVGIIDSVSQISNVMSQKFGGFLGALFQGDAKRSMGNLRYSLANLRYVIGHINALADVQISDATIGNIRKTITSISDIGTSLWWDFGGFIGYGNVKKNVSGLRESLKELRYAIRHINKLGGEKIDDGAISHIKDIISQISKAFDSASVSSLQETVTAFVNSIKDALAQLDELNKEYTIQAKVKLSKDFDSSVSKVVKQIKEARRKILLAWAGIPTSLTKTISLNIKAKTSVTGVTSGISSGVSKVTSGLGKYFNSTGGLIYRAKGGNIPWKKRGTDTVPAMLTPGEFVHNKQAVNAFGIDFMRKVNNLDMKGAMNELMHRAGGMANINRGTTITNNNYNNQKVTINNNGATGAGYTFKSASRFVGAF